MVDKNKQDSLGLHPQKLELITQYQAEQNTFVRICYLHTHTPEM